MLVWPDRKYFKEILRRYFSNISSRDKRYEVKLFGVKGHDFFLFSCLAFRKKICKVQKYC